MVLYLFKGAKQGSAEQLVVSQLHSIAHMPLRQCRDLRNEGAQVPKAFDNHPQLLHDLQSVLAQQLHPKKKKITAHSRRSNKSTVGTKQKHCATGKAVSGLSSQNRSMVCHGTVEESYS